MTFYGLSLSTEFLQLLLLAVLIVVSFLIGRRLYASLRHLHEAAKERIDTRKRPSLSDVLLDMSWAPVIGLVVLAPVRGVLELFTVTPFVRLVATFLDMLLLALFLWFALRVITRINKMNGEEQEEKEA